MEKYGHGGDVYGFSGVALDFSVNTNPLGMPDEVRRALIAHVDEYTRYPDPLCRELRAAIAARENVPQEMVLCGNGAADLIYRLCYAMRPRKALVCAPTFSEYERALELTGCEVAHFVLRKEDQFELTADIEGLVSPGVDALFLCHPNNPTGRLVPEGLLRSIIDRARQNGATVIVDECFLGFTNGSSSGVYLEETPGLVVLKAFTKMYSMAGLRLGYALSSNIGLLDRAGAAAQCWSVSVPAQVAGVAALSCGGWEERTRQITAEERRFLSAGLSGFGVEVFPSDANYLLFRCGAPLFEPLLEQGILIRHCGNFRGLDDSYYRVGVKLRDENTALLRAVGEVL